VAYCTTTSWRSFEGLHCVHLPASTLYDYIDWGPTTISMANPEDNGASVASGNRPAFEYTLILLWFYLFIMINLSYLSSVRIVLTLVALISNMSFLHMLNLSAQFIMIYILFLIWKLPNFTTFCSSGMAVRSMVIILSSYLLLWNWTSCFLNSLDVVLLLPSYSTLM
jgi:hypothetical protein